MNAPRKISARYTIFGFTAALALLAQACNLTPPATPTAVIEAPPATSAPAPSMTGTATTAELPTPKPTSLPATTPPATQLAPTTTTPFPASSRSLGINLDAVRHASSQLLFVDLFKQSRPFAGSAEELADDQLPLACVDGRGWPRQIPCPAAPGKPATTYIAWNIGGYYPNGEYTLIFEGAGTIELSGTTGERIFTEAGRYSVSVNTDPGGAGIQGIMLRITASAPDDPIRDIHFVMPGYADVFESQPFYPPFVERLRIFGVLRFMNALRTNNSSVAEWAQRTPFDAAQQTWPTGLALEYIYLLANEVGADPWINIPERASDDYVRQLARMLAANLNPERKVYIEYANEVWNPGFSAAGYAAQQGQALWPEMNETAARQGYTVRRSLEIFEIFAAEFGGAERLVQLLPTHTARAEYTEGLLQALADPRVNPSGAAVDAITHSAYFGGRVIQEIVNENRINDIATEEILDRLQVEIETTLATFLSEQKAVADRYGLPVVGYEGGQSMNASKVKCAGMSSAACNELVLGNAAFIEKIRAANRHPRMKEIYLELYALWASGDRGVLAPYLYVYYPRTCCNWGALEYAGQPLADAPKYQALREASLAAETR